MSTSKSVMKALNQRPIAYYPIYRDMTGSTTAGILLSQLMYWFSKKDKFHKTDAEIIQETRLTEKELKLAKKRLKSLGFITISREGMPAKTYYEIDWERYEKAVESIQTSQDETGQTCLAERAEQDGPKGPNTMVPKGQSYNDISFDIDYTETTTENTRTPLTPQGEPADDLPDWLDKKAWSEWVEFRKEKRKRLTPMSVKKQLAFLEKRKEEHTLIIEQSIRNGWTGLFELKDGHGRDNAGKPAEADYSAYERFGYIPPEKREPVQEWPPFPGMEDES